MPPRANADLDKLSYIPVFDGCRGIAVLLVVVMHVYGLPLGWLGVDVFFVLSGFLITRILLNTKDCDGYLKTFYARRFLRIFPVYYLTLLVVALVAVKPEHMGRMWWYVGYLSNFIWLQPGADVGTLAHTWSLAVEEQFYIFWPFLVLLLQRRAMMTLCVAMWVMAVAFRLGLGMYPELEDAYTYSLFTRSDGILFGSMLALLVKGGLRHSEANMRLALRVAIVGGLVVCAMAATRNLSFSRHTPLMSAVGMPSVVLTTVFSLWFAMGVPPEHLLHRLLCWRPLAYLGRTSYGIYLYHLPLLRIVHPKLDVPETLGWRLLTGTLLGLAAIGVAALSWKFFEAPLIGLKRRFEYKLKEPADLSRPVNPPGTA